ncbi:transcriptional regulator [Clostridium botulinum]|nr:transcriptional regulator [Clostridium botulinum]
MDKETFRRTERMLYVYYRNLKEMEKLEYICNRLEQQKEKIRKDIQETNIDLEEESISISYSERIQTSSISSHCDREIENQITKLENEWKLIRKKILKNRARIRELERSTATIRYSIRMLPEEDRNFIIYKYKNNKSIVWIATVMFGGATTTAYRKREEILKSVSNN